MLKKHTTIVIGISLLVSIIIFLLAHPLRNRSRNHIASNVFQSGNGWGYNILVNDSLLIHQETIPARQANHGFAGKAQAEAAAGLVISKLQKGGFPSLSEKELDLICRSNPPAQ